MLKQSLYSLLLPIFVTLLSPLAFAQGVDQDKNSVEVERPPTPEEALGKYTENLTEQYNKGRMQVFVGQQTVLRQAEEVLSQAGNKTLYILGESGSGKTAVVEALAGRLGEGREIIRLDLNKLEAGTGYRGTLEGRLEAILEGIKASQGKKILFIDEFHTIMKVSGVADTLKPAIARGEISVIAVTTFDDYRDSIEKDKSITSRGRTIEVPVPTAAEVLSILRANKSRLQEKHKVHITESALQEAVKLAARYLSDKPLTRTALALIDGAMSSQALENKKGSSQILEIEQKVEQLKLEQTSLQDDLKVLPNNEDIKSRLSSLRGEISALTDQMHELKGGTGESKQNLEKQLQRLNQEAVEARNKGNFTRAGEIMYKEIPELQQKIKSAGGNSESLVQAVTERDIARAVAKEVGIDVSAVTKSESEKIRDLEKNIKSRVIGQDHLANMMVQAIKIRRANVEPHKGPAGSFLILGPTGVGKTEIAKAFSEFLFDDPNALVRIDMNEFIDRHSVGRLIGTPIGYEGSNEGGLLTEPVRRKRYRVILLDEIEKAHRDIFSTILRILDEGQTRDGRGRLVDFRDTVIIATSNVGSEYVLNKDKISLRDIETKYGFSQGELEGRSAAEIDSLVANKILDQHGFSPEFRNRLSAIAFTNKLTPEIATKIASLKLEEQRRHLEKEAGIKLNYNNSVIEALARVGFDAEYGARPIKRAQTDAISTLLASLVIDSGARKGDSIQLDFKVAANQLGGEIKATLNNSSSIAKDVMFRSMNSPAYTASRASGELGKPLDTSNQALVEKAQKAVTRK